MFATTVIRLVCLSIASVGVLAAPIQFEAVVVDKRATACFLTGSTALPAEVEAGIPALAKSVTCDTSSKGIGGSQLTKVKSVKFFLQFQIARVRTARGETVATLGAAGTVEHQQGKVIKNAVGASSAEIAKVNALAKQL
ncbi:hypothetical protein FRC19_000725 [Serendipita sp. 401]|nr:hypothetical protein FRC19_000725 [Serendipita sp. 401]